MLIYLAGGMKSNWQDKVIKSCNLHSFIDPRKHGLLNELDYTPWDLDGVRKSDLVIAYMDSENPSGYGLSLEVGYAHAYQKTIWYVCEDKNDRQKYFGMVRACATKLFYSLECAIKELA